MKDAEIVSSLIGDIYDAALDPALWPPVLQECAAFVGGVAAALFVKDSTLNILWDVNAGYDPHYRQLYYDRYAKADPFTAAQFLFAVEEVISLEDVISRSEFLESQFFKEWVRPQAWMDALSATLDKSSTSYASFSVVRHERDGFVDAEARRRMCLLVPHMRRAVLVGKTIDLNKLELAAISNVLDGLAAGLFLVGAAGDIAFANASGRAMLQEGVLFQERQGALTSTDRQGNDVLRESVAAARNGDAAVGGKGIAVPLMAHGGERWLAHVLPLTSGARHRAGTPRSAVAAVFVRRATPNAPAALETIARLYGLTPGEVRVLRGAVEHDGVAAVAAALKVSEATVKTHLHHVFCKTGTRRQADLVKLAAAHASPFEA